MTRNLRDYGLLPERRPEARGGESSFGSFVERGFRVTSSIGSWMNISMKMPNKATLWHWRRNDLGPTGREPKKQRAYGAYFSAGALGLRQWTVSCKPSWKTRRFKLKMDVPLAKAPGFHAAGPPRGGDGTVRTVNHFAMRRPNERTIVRPIQCG